MAAISEKILWPIVAIFIFGVLAGFYIDDRRRLAQEGDSPKEHGGNAAEHKEHGGNAAEHQQASNEHAGKKVDEKPSSATQKQSAPASSANGQSSSGHSSQSPHAAGATSMDINEYLAKLSSETDAELKANVAHHQGFHGGIDEYLSGAKPKVSKNTQASSNAKQGNNNQANGATSMSMDEYHAKASGSGSADSSMQASTNSGAYHGNMDGYLAKYGEGKQTEINNKGEKPFNQKEHMGFHGSYEDYAKKYN